MPIYRVKAPDGKTYRIEGPAGASDEQVIAALKSRLSDAEESAKRRDITDIEYAPPKEKGILAQLKRGARELASSSQTAFEAATGSPEEAAKRGIARGEEIASEYEGGPSLERIKQAYEESGLLGAGKEVLGSIPEAIAGQGANIGTALASARLGAMAGAPLGPVGVGGGAILGALAPSIAQQFGSDVERQAQEQIAAKQEVSIDRGKAFAAALPQAALDVASEAIPLGKTILGTVLGKEVKQLLSKGGAKELAAAEKLAEEKIYTSLAKGTLIGAGTEIPTEVTQQILERWQAGLPLTNDDAMKEYADTAYQVALLGPIGALGRVAQRGEAGRTVEEARAKEIEQAAQEAETRKKEAEERRITGPQQMTLPGVPEAPMPPAPTPQAPTPEAPQAPQAAPGQMELPLQPAMTPEEEAGIKPPVQPELPGIPEAPLPPAPAAPQAAPTPEAPQAPEAAPGQMEMDLPQPPEPTPRKVDPLYDKAVELIRQTGRAGTTTLQKGLGIGWTRASKIIKELEEGGVVSAPDTGKGNLRKVLPFEPATGEGQGVGTTSTAGPVGGGTGVGPQVPVRGQGAGPRKTEQPPKPRVGGPLAGTPNAPVGETPQRPALETLPRVEKGPIPRPVDPFTGNPLENEQRVVEQGVRGKNIFEATKFVADTAPHPMQREIASRVLNVLDKMRQIGGRFHFAILDSVRDLHPSDRASPPNPDSSGTTFTYHTEYTKSPPRIHVYIKGAKRKNVGLSYNTLLHELIHAATVVTINHARQNIDSSAARHVADLDKLFNKVRSELNKVKAKAKAGERLTQAEKVVAQSNFGLNAKEILAWSLSDPDAQAWMETVPYPQHKNLWNKFVQVIRDMLGLDAKSGTALAELLRVSDKLLNADINELVHLGDNKVITPKVKAEISEQVVNAPAQIVNDFPRFDKTISEGFLNAVSNVPDAVRRAINGFMTMPQLAEVYDKFIPSLKELVSILNVRASKLMQRREAMDKALMGWYKVAQKHKAILPKFFDIANESTRQQIQFAKKLMDGKTPNPDYDPNNALTKQFESLPDDLQKVYFELLDYYKKQSAQFFDLLANSLSASQMSKLRQEYEKKRLKVYLPLFRQGDYWVTYQDANNETVTLALGSKREQDKVVEWAKANSVDPQSVRAYARSSKVSWKQIPPTGFVGDIVKQLADKNLPDDVIDTIYETFLNYLPAESVRQQFRPRENVLGFEPDVFQVFANMGSRMANQLTNMEYALEIERVMEQVRGEVGEKAPKPLQDVLANVEGQLEYMRDPKNAGLASRLSYFSYLWYIAGNVSSALVNISQVPMVVYPLLGGKYGMGRAYSALSKARKDYMNGGWDTNSQFMPDWTFGAAKNLKQEYRDLFDAAVRQGAIRRATGYELAEARKVRTEDYVGLRAKVEHGLGWAFQNSERANREVTLLAAYDLAMKESEGRRGSYVDRHNAAIREAIQLVNESHGTSLAETGPRFFQNDIGKVMFTFKRFAQAQIYLMAKLFNQAFREESPEVRAVARRQLLGIAGMSYVFAGVQGMPLYGAGALLASLTMGDDDEPFDSDEKVRELIGDLGYKGPINQLLRVDIASRTGFNGLLWRDDPKRLSEVGPFLYAAETAMGPSYSVYRSLSDAVKHFNDGYYERGFESMTPGFVRNGLKAIRLGTEGARTKDGVPIVEDIGAYNSFMQVLGFNPVELAEARARAGAMKTADKKIEARRAALFDKLDMARMSGDRDGEIEVRDEMREFSRKHPAVRITEANIATSYRQRRKRERDSVEGVSLSPKLRRELMEKYGS